MPLSTIFQLYRGGLLFLGRKPEGRKKNTAQPQIKGKRYHLMINAETVYNKN
jgi:hypothetical protein